MRDVFSDTVCALGEGPLWHPTEQALYWFDILGMRLYRRKGAEETFWEFDEHVSAAGWVEDGQLLIASETALSHFDTATGESTFLQPLESDNSVTRSNDGRADPWGGLWIGTMGKNAEPKAGAIYRYVEGTLHKLFDKITISNAICFAPDHSCAYFTDTRKRKVLRVALDADGFPDAKPELFVDLTQDELNPDGAVVDADGKLWVAQWGASRVACYDTDGRFERAINVPAVQTSCPAFGGPDLGTLFITTAAVGLDPAGPNDGMTFAVDAGTTGQKEHQIIL
ncbi:SMP-30/gluconolactonase/LRE family protein [Marivita sp. S6314]|uniref:SMP-30/gluconolactonase/LRE family protein n=1 Tax=Marivita sp. S6314 TaxID=2926406 RepID=UPI001FF4936D|nr:SMP-30/gluconolactonase/LRE family protein [Marivita sp. S6314]MCK0148405.1 SMP-30/gluconolactonase/LRE family protein [Marivita sp. S6314]